MKIKQQKLIKNFLINEFGEEKGYKIFDEEQKMFSCLQKNTKDESEKQMK